MTTRLRFWIVFLLVVCACQGAGRAQQGEAKLGIPITTLPYPISQSGVYVLTQDFVSLNMGSGAAITINASDVVLDFNGHTISNTAAGASTLAYGVYAANQTNVTVRNGTVQGFMTGVGIIATDASTTSYGHLVEKMNVSACTYEGISLVSSNSTVRSCQVSNIGGSSVLGDSAGAYGIELSGTGLRCLDNDVSQVSATSSTLGASYAVYLDSASDAFVVDNRLSAAQYGLYFGAAAGQYRHNLATGMSLQSYVGGTDAGMNIVDANNNGIDDEWEMLHFGNLDHIDPAEDYDGDGLTNLQEYQQGTEPTDYYNGIAPVLQIVSGDKQCGINGAVLSKALVALVEKGSSVVPAANAPVTYQVLSGGALISANSSGPWVSSCVVLTGADGHANIYCKLSSDSFSDVVSTIQASAGSSAPVVFSASYISVQRIVAGSQHTLALDTNGGVWSWGNNSVGALGNSSTGKSAIARVAGVNGVGFLDGVRAIAAGGSHSLALKTDGTVVGWGYDADGELGNGSSIYEVSTPVPMMIQSGQTTATLSGVIAIAAGNDFSLMLKSDGSVWSCGDNFYGKLGNGNTNSQYYAVQVLGPGGSGTTLNGIIAIAAGGSHSVALKSDHTVWAWGYNYYNQLGNNTGNSTNSVPVQVKGEGGNGQLGNVVSISVGCGGYHTLALKDDGTVWAWGYNGYGQCGNDQENNSVPYPYKVVGLGVPVSNYYNNPSTTVLGKLSGVVDIAAGNEHSMAILSDGSVCSWGYGYRGQLGGSSSTLNQNNSCDYPELVASPTGTGKLHDIVSISAGGNHSFAIGSYKGVWIYLGWGDNGSEEIDGYLAAKGNQTGASDFLFPRPIFQIVDSDNDGLTDPEEFALGTDPLNPDTNGNGIPDGAEYHAGFNPAVSNGDPFSLSGVRNAGISGLDYYGPPGSQLPTFSSGAPVITLTSPQGATLQPQ